MIRLGAEGGFFRSVRVVTAVLAEVRELGREAMQIIVQIPANKLGRMTLLGATRIGRDIPEWGKRATHGPVGISIAVKKGRRGYRSACNDLQRTC